MIVSLLMIVKKSSWLISLFINASDILLSVLFNILLTNITIYSVFFLVVFNRVFFTIPVGIENARLKLALAIPAGAPITVANDAIEMLTVVTDKTMTYQNRQKKQFIY